jgi:hypothetical protein
MDRDSGGVCDRCYICDLIGTQDGAATGIVCVLEGYQTGARMMVIIVADGRGHLVRPEPPVVPIRKRT